MPLLISLANAAVSTVPFPLSRAILSAAIPPLILAKLITVAPTWPFATVLFRVITSASWLPSTAESSLIVAPCFTSLIVRVATLFIISSASLSYTPFVILLTSMFLLLSAVIVRSPEPACVLLDTARLNAVFASLIASYLILAL